MRRLLSATENYASKAKRPKEIKQLKKDLQRKEKALAEAAARIILGKKPVRSGGARGRLIGTPDRQQVIALAEEAVEGGCRRAQVCSALEISLRPYQRWTRDGDSDNAQVDGRKGNRRVAPANKLGEDERRQILAIVNSTEFNSSSRSQIVPTLADRGEYLASESTVDRILNAKQHHHRGRGKKPSTRVVTSYCATEPNRVWAWDIT